MKKIICNISTFDLHQYIMVTDTETKETKSIAISTLDNLSEDILSACLKYNIHSVVLAGNHSFINAYAEEMETINANKYNINNIKIEVL